jgi:hypothetical protein
MGMETILYLRRYFRLSRIVARGMQKNEAKATCSCLSTSSTIQLL